MKITKDDGLWDNDTKLTISYSVDGETKEIETDLKTIKETAKKLRKLRIQKEKQDDTERKTKEE